VLVITVFFDYLKPTQVEIGGAPTIL